MNILDTIVYSIWFENPHKYEYISCGRRNRLCGALHLGGILIAMIILCVVGLTRGLTVPIICIWMAAMLLTAVPRFFITAPPELKLQEEWLRKKTNVMIKVKDMESDELTNMMYNPIYSQGVVYTEEGMKVVDLPLYNYNKTWVAFDSDLE